MHFNLTQTGRESVYYIFDTDKQAGLQTGSHRTREFLFSLAIYFL